MRKTWRSRKAEAHDGVERLGRGGVAAERLLDHDASASTVRLRDSPASPSFVVTSGKTVGGVAR